MDLAVEYKTVASGFDNHRTYNNSKAEMRSHLKPQFTKQEARSPAPKVSRLSLMPQANPKLTVSIRVKPCN